MAGSRAYQGGDTGGKSRTASSESVRTSGPASPSLWAPSGPPGETAGVRGGGAAKAGEAPVARSLLAVTGMKTTTIWALSLILGLAGLTACNPEEREGMEQEDTRGIEEGEEQGLDQGFEAPGEQQGGIEEPEQQ